MPDSNHLTFMREALLEAEKAADFGEVPVGAVVVLNGEIVARAHNEVEYLGDATAHAELLALRRASQAIGDWRLNEVGLYVTLEPCSMCIGAMLLSRVNKLYFGCNDLLQGAVGSVFDLSAHPDLPHQITVFPEILAEESQSLLRCFFVERRKERPEPLAANT